MRISRDDAHASRVQQGPGSQHRERRDRTPESEPGFQQHVSESPTKAEMVSVRIPGSDSKAGPTRFSSDGSEATVRKRTYSVVEYTTPGLGDIPPASTTQPHKRILPQPRMKTPYQPNNPTSKQYPQPTSGPILYPEPTQQGRTSYGYVTKPPRAPLPYNQQRGADYSADHTAPYPKPRSPYSVPVAAPGTPLSRRYQPHVPVADATPDPYYQDAPMPVGYAQPSYGAQPNFEVWEAQLRLLCL